MRVHPANYKSQGLYWQVPLILLLLFLSIAFSVWQMFSKPKIQVVEKVIEKKVFVEKACEPCEQCAVSEAPEITEEAQEKLLEELKK